MTKKVLLTSVCRPIGPDYGDATSVGYELLFGQVTRAQGLFSPRANHLHFSLEYIANNLDAPAVVLQYPSRSELIRELKKGYDYVGVSFILATFHRMKEAVALIRKYSPGSKIILGGYGTVLSDAELKPYGDFICREEGVGFMRRVLGEPEIPMPYKHPMIVSRLKVFSAPASNTGMIFAGLGCPNGCDFCCTSHFFKRKHIRLLPTGRDIYDVVERYLALDPKMVFTLLDEDFLLNKKRAMEFRECVIKGGKPVSMFVFSSIRAISQYTIEEILEMGIDGFWIGYEGTRSGYAKQQGRPVADIFREFRQHGVTILASMIVGLPYQTDAIIQEELDGLLELKPSLSQFLIYGPTPGTPFYERIMSEGLMHKEYLDDREGYYRKCTGFAAMVKSPQMTPQEIEAAQDHCFKEDFERIGPSIYRVVESWLEGYRKLVDSPNVSLKDKADQYKNNVRKAYPIFLAGRILGPNRSIRQWIGNLEREAHRTFGPPELGERLSSFAALFMALWSGIKLKLKIFQHPSLVRHVYRLPEEAPRPARLWRNLVNLDLSITMEMRPEKSVWVRLEKIVNEFEARRLGDHLRESLMRGKENLVLDLTRLTHLGGEAAKQLAISLKEHRSRIHLELPASFVNPRVASWLALISLYRR